jgi:hypothetical protein
MEQSSVHPRAMRATASPSVAGGRTRRWLWRPLFRCPGSSVQAPAAGMLEMRGLAPLDGEPSRRVVSPVARYTWYPCFEYPYASKRCPAWTVFAAISPVSSCSSLRATSVGSAFGGCSQEPCGNSQYWAQTGIGTAGRGEFPGPLRAGRSREIGLLNDVVDALRAVAATDRIFANAHPSVFIHKTSSGDFDVDVTVRGHSHPRVLSRRSQASSKERRTS